MSFLKLSLLVSLVTICCSGDLRGPKVWWAKPVLKDFYIAGRPSVRHLKYLAESGIKSIMSIMDFKTPIPELDIPTTTEEERIVTQELGLKFGVVMTPGMGTRDLELYERFGKVYEQMEKPVFYHCAQGYAAMFSSFGYFVNKTKHDSNFEPRVTLRDLWEMGNKRGYYWDWDFKDGRPTVAEVLHSFLGEPDFEIPKRAVSLPNFMMIYWWPLTIYDRYYAMGQFQSDQLEQIKEAGFTTIVNLRQPIEMTPREEVTLLNVKDNTGGDRQNIDRLRENRINASRPNSYISANSLYNFDLQNQLEFGDEKGYSEPLERAAVEGVGLKYYHINVGMGEKMTSSDWRRVRDQLKEATKTGNVIIHSRTGWKAVAVALLLAGEEHQFDHNWAKQQAAGIAYAFEDKNGYAEFNDLLRDELGSVGAASHVRAGLLSLLALLVSLLCFYY